MALVQRRRRRWLIALLMLVAVLGLPAAAAWTYWSGADDPLHGPGVAGSATVSQGSSPTVDGSATGVVVSWGSSALSTGLPVDGYIIKRYSSGTGSQHTIGAGCAGTTTDLTCTESDVPAGHWRYTVTPTLSGAWRGEESSKSGTVTTGPGTLTLTKSLFGAPLPGETAGSMNGFAPNEAVVYSLDGGTSLTGSPATVDDEGAATITSLTIPAAADGAHTVQVTGSTSGVVARAGIQIDTTPPVLSGFTTPVSNAAGWNTTPVEVDGTSTDGDGSGIAYVKGTIDGSDPKTSPSTYEWAGVPVVFDETTTLRYYGADHAGNETAITTMHVKIDKIAPTFTAQAIEVTGGAVVGSVAPPATGLAYYRGTVAGSFRLQIAISDEGGSGTGTIGTTALISAATGFTHEPGLTKAGDDGPYLTNPFIWVAGTTSTPTGTIVATDVAGNTTIGSGALLNDSTAPAGGSAEGTGLVGTGNRYSNSVTLSLASQRGTDAGSGLAVTGARLLRASAALTSSDGLRDGACGAYGTQSQIGALDPAATTSDTVPTAGRCYRYTYAVPDQVGNVATYDSADIKVQTTPSAVLSPVTTRITRLSGLSSQYVSGSTVAYKPELSGSFSVVMSATDALSGVTQLGFPRLGGFTGGGPMTTPSGTTFATSYSWAGNATAPSPGPQPVAASDHAGLSRTNPAAFSVLKDVTPPTHALTMTAATGAYLSGSTLYYRSTSAGSFRLVNTPTDDASGPASVTYPSLGLWGWTHATQTVSTPSGGPYASAAYSFAAHPASPGTYSISGQDNLARQSTFDLRFAEDQTPPSGVSITYAGGVSRTLSIPLSRVNGTDSASGLNEASGIVRRDVATLTLNSSPSTSTCGSFPGTFGTTLALTGNNDASVSHARCYKYRYLVSDNVGNQTTYTSSTIVKVDTR
jgi:hypothetical protein